jgi:rhodanese-related sulfurtransferase
VTPNELAARLEAGSVTLVDVRWPNEWEAGRIEGAVHIPQDELDDRLDELDTGRLVVTVCRRGERSAIAADELRAEGFRAENLEGGMDAWAQEGLPVVDGEGRPGAVVDPEPPPDDRPPEHQRLQAELLRVLFDVQDHFGDHDPSDEEVRDFLRQRLIDEGRTPDEADDFLARMDETDPPVPSR